MSGEVMDKVVKVGVFGAGAWRKAPIFLDTSEILDAKSLLYAIHRYSWLRKRLECSTLKQ